MLFLKKFADKICKSAFLTVTLCVVLTLSLSSCGYVRFFMKSFDAPEPMGSDEVIDFSGTAGGIDLNRGDVSIPKDESIKTDKDGITSAGQAYNSISSVYYAVADSVVEITTETVQTGIFTGQYVTEGAGSGVIIDASGLIVTNNHVIDGASYVTVRLTDGSEYEAALVGKDAASDLAVIKIDPADKELCVASFGCSGDLVVGEDIVVIGNPLGSLGGTLTTGIISATERNIYVDGEQMVLLQTNAAINPGNSGGGLFNMAGKLVGVVNAKAAGNDIEGLGFAIPVDIAHTVIEDLINYGYVRGIADHGLALLDINSQNLPYAYQKYGITTEGVVIIGSQYGGGFEFGDVVIAINGIEISSSYEVDVAVKAYAVGETVTFTVVRNGRRENVKFTLRERVPETVSFN